MFERLARDCLKYYCLPLSAGMPPGSRATLESGKVRDCCSLEHWLLPAQFNLWSLGKCTKVLIPVTDALFDHESVTSAALQAGSGFHFPLWLPLSPRRQPPQL